MARIAVLFSCCLVFESKQAFAARLQDSLEGERRNYKWRPLVLSSKGLVAGRSSASILPADPIAGHAALVGPIAPVRRADTIHMSAPEPDQAEDDGFLQKAASKAASTMRDIANTYAQELEASSDSDTDSDAVVEFPPPLSGPERIARALTFYSRLVPVLFRYKFVQAKLEAEKNLLGREVSEEEERAVWEEVDEWGASKVSDTITDLKGFYVKTGQVLSSRPDLFSEPYISKLTQLQDGLEPMPGDLMRAVVSQELMGGEPLSELFADFDDEPLGAASIAQVHKATLLDGRVVAVKVQRPNIEPKLRGDIENLKRITKQLREQLPLDYYRVFVELGEVLKDELNFFAEAQAMRKIAAAVSYDVNGEPSDAPVSVPLPIGELVSQRVIVMDFVEGVPLNRLKDTMKERNIDPNSPEAKIGGIRILDSLSEAFKRQIFGAGFVHGDPHPGNIFVKKGAEVSLIDCGQVKAVSRAARLRLARTLIKIAEYQEIKRGPHTEDELKAALRALAESAFEFGLEFSELEEGKSLDDLAAAVALFLFGDKDMELPGGYSMGELDENSPLQLLTGFPQELVLVGRATVLLKGISASLDVPFSLADSWAPACRNLLAEAGSPKMPLWARKEADLVAAFSIADEGSRLRMRDAIKPWAKGKGKAIASTVFQWLPGSVQSKVTSVAARLIQGKRQKQAPTS